MYFREEYISPGATVGMRKEDRELTSGRRHRRGQMRGTGAGEKGKEIAVDKTVSARKQAFEIYK
jgi:hypothetical protein